MLEYDVAIVGGGPIGPDGNGHTVLEHLGEGGYSPCRQFHVGAGAGGYLGARSGQGPHLVDGKPRGMRGYAMIVKKTYGR